MNYYLVQFACLFLFVLLCAVEGFLSIKIESKIESSRKFLQGGHLRRLEKGRDPLEQKRQVLKKEHKQLGNEQLRTREKQLDFFERLDLQDDQSSPFCGQRRRRAISAVQI